MPSSGGQVGKFLARGSVQVTNGRQFVTLVPPGRGRRGAERVVRAPWGVDQCGRWTVVRRRGRRGEKAGGWGNVQWARKSAVDMSRPSCVRCFQAVQPRVVWARDGGFGSPALVGKDWVRGDGFEAVVRSARPPTAIGGRGEGIAW